jgi:hypothetical protein
VASDRTPKAAPRSVDIGVGDIDNDDEVEVGVVRQRAGEAHWKDWAAALRPGISASVFNRDRTRTRPDANSARRFMTARSIRAASSALSCSMSAAKIRRAPPTSGVGQRCWIALSSSRSRLDFSKHPSSSEYRALLGSSRSFEP